MQSIISVADILHIFNPVNLQFILLEHQFCYMKPSRFLLFFVFVLCVNGVYAQGKNLFNGRDLKGWHADVPALQKDSSLVNPFIVRKGMLVSLGTPGGHLITDSLYENYRLEVHYRFAGNPGNCGVLVHASTPRALYSMFPKSIEVQMQYQNAGDFWCIEEDISVPYMEQRRGPKANWGINGNKTRRIIHLEDGAENPIGEWNTMMIECLGNTIKVWVNNKMMNAGYNCTVSRGQIALQAEGSEVEFAKVVLTQIR